MSKQKLWIVSELFYPVDTSTSYIMTRIAEYMAPHFDIEVLTGPSQYDSSQYDDTPPKEFSFRINRIETGNFDKNGLFSRTIRLLWLTFSFCWFILRRVKPGQSVFMVTNPAFLITVIPILKKIRRFRLIILVHDVFPENLAAAGMIKETNFIYPILKGIFNWAYRNADKLIVLGVDMKKVMTKKTSGRGDGVSIVQNWADLKGVEIKPFETNRIVEKYNLKNKIVLVFAGNIGRVQGIEGLINLIEKVENDNIHFLFVGDGALAPQIRELAERTSKVTCLGRMLRERQNEFLNAGHVGVVSINDRMIGLGVPSKSYNILAAGKPILFLGNTETEIAMMVKENNLGWAFEHAQKELVLEFLNSLRLTDQLLGPEVSQKIRKFVAESYSEGKMLEKLKQVIEA